MKRGTQAVLSGVFLIVETAIAFGVFFGAAYGLTRLAEYRQASPIYADTDGVVLLRPIKATLQGGLSRFPTTWEERTDGYSNNYGRELAKERENRKIGEWKSSKDTAEWQFALPTAGEYRVEVELAAPANEAGSEIEIKIGDTTLVGTVPDTGGWDKWQNLSLGSVQLGAGAHTAVLKATSVKHKAAMNVAKVVLRPGE